MTNSPEDMPPQPPEPRPGENVDKFDFVIDYGEDNTPVPAGQPGAPPADPLAPRPLPDTLSELPDLPPLPPLPPLPTPGSPQGMPPGAMDPLDPFGLNQAIAEPAPSAANQAVLPSAAPDTASPSLEDELFPIPTPETPPTLPPLVPLPSPQPPATAQAAPAAPVTAPSPPVAPEVTEPTAFERLLMTAAGAAEELHARLLGEVLVQPGITTDDTESQSVEAIRLVGLSNLDPNSLNAILKQASSP